MKIYGGDCCKTAKKPTALRLESTSGGSVRIAVVDAATGIRLSSGNAFELHSDGRMTTCAGFRVGSDYENPFTDTPRTC